MSNTPIKALTVHCSATGPSINWRAKDIDRAHRLRGFLRIGYHYVIGRDGLLETGRPENMVGAHVEGHNTGNIGICMIGGVAADGKTPQNNFTPEQFKTLRKLLVDLLAKYPKAEIKGHRDWPGVRKDCPCFDVKTWWLPD